MWSLKPVDYYHRFTVKLWELQVTTLLATRDLSYISFQTFRSLRLGQRLYDAEIIARTLVLSVEYKVVLAVKCFACYKQFRFRARIDIKAQTP